MANIATRIILFLSSYAPLFFILAVKNVRSSCRSAVFFFGVAFLSLLVLYLYLKTVRGFASDTVIAADITAKDGDAMSYIVTYLLPFLGIQMKEWDNAVALGMVLFVVGLLYVNSNMIYINPVLNLCGFHIFEIHSTEGKRMMLITRRSFVRVQSTLSIIPVGDYVVLEVY